MKQNIKTVLYIIACATLLLLGGCSNAPAPQAPAEAETATGKMPVVASFYAMGELARAIGGDKVDVRTVVPDGEEPHDFQPKASDLTALSKAKVLVLNGCGMEQSWAVKAVQTAGANDLIVVTASDGTDVIHVPMKHILHHDTATEPVDPHIWLSPANALVEAANIRDAYIQADPDNQAYYEEQYDHFAGQMEDLMSTYKRRFAVAPQKHFVTGHAAFAYLARDFGLSQKSLTNVFASGEPSIRNLRDLVDFCKAERIPVIFVENMESPKIYQTLARETGASLESLDTMESSDGDKTYFDVMSENLEKIAAACEAH